MLSKRNNEIWKVKRERGPVIWSRLWGWKLGILCFCIVTEETELTSCVHTTIIDCELLSSCRLMDRFDGGESVPLMSPQTKRYLMRPTCHCTSYLPRPFLFLPSDGTTLAKILAHPSYPPHVWMMGRIHHWNQTNLILPIGSISSFRPIVFVRHNDLCVSIVCLPNIGRSACFWGNGFIHVWTGLDFAVSEGKSRYWFSWTGCF